MLRSLESLPARGRGSKLDELRTDPTNLAVAPRAGAWIETRLLARVSKKLVAEEGLLTELGPARLDRDLQKYIWNGKPHLSLKDLREYLNRYIYLPRLKNQGVLVKAVQAAVSSMLPGPFAYAERWNEKSDAYLRLAIERAGNAAVVIDGDSLIVKPDVAEAHRPTPPQPASGGSSVGPGDQAPWTGEQPAGGSPTSPPPQKRSRQGSPAQA